MKILMINSVCGIRSTGRICTNLAVELEKKGHEVKIAYGRGNVPKEYEKYAIKFCDDFDVKKDALKSRIFDNAGFNSKNSTNKLIKWIEQYDPDIIHLHNIHGYYINIELLFRYLKCCGKKIIWTLHDCWSFTGHCAYFEYVNCMKWKDCCERCPLKKEYPKSVLIDNSKRNFLKKKELFTDVPNLTIVTPSLWLKKLIKMSFLKDYPAVVINNGIDLSIFKPTNSALREKYDLEDKKVILGVAAVWDKRKGLEEFIRLNEILPNDYVIVLIGLNEEQAKIIPSGIIGISRTNSSKELAEWYTLADVFVNPTLEDNYPTTNLESIACGTPVITYDTGGSSESASLFGKVVSKGNYRQIMKDILKCNFNKTNYNIEMIGSDFSARKYISLYKGDTIE